SSWCCGSLTTISLSRDWFGTPRSTLDSELSSAKCARAIGRFSGSCCGRHNRSSDPQKKTRPWRSGQERCRRQSLTIVAPMRTQSRPNVPLLAGGCFGRRVLAVHIAQAGSLALQSAEVIQLRAAHLRRPDHIDPINDFGVHRENALHAL